MRPANRRVRAFLPAASFLWHAVWAVLGIAAVTAPAVADDGSAADLRQRRDGSDWPAFNGPTADGRSTETGLRTDWSRGLPVVWQVEAGEGYGAPSTSLGRLFFFDRHGDRARLTCRRAETGDELWRSEYPTRYEDMYGYSGGPRAVPVVDGSRVFTYGVEGRLRAHRVTDGRLLWEVDTAAGYGVKQNFFGVGAAPVVEGDLLIAQVGGSPPDSPGISSGKVVANGSGVVAFDKRTGEERYRLADELASYAVPRIATLGDRRWGFVFARGGLVAFEPTAGRLDFHFPWRARLLESVNAATPVVVGSRVFLTETYGPGGVLLDIASGAPRVVWQDGRRERSLASHWATPVHHRGYLYGSSGRGQGDAELRCVRLDTGEVMWRHRGMGRSTLIYADEHLVVLGERGELWLVRATPEGYRQVAGTRPKLDGKPLMRHPAWHAPVLSHGLLYVRGRDRLVALELIPPPPAAGSR